MLTLLNQTKRLLGIAVLTAGSFTVAGLAQAAYPAHMESDLVKICTAIRDNKPLRLQMAVKDSGVSYRALQKGLVCNGDDMFTFAEKNQAHASSALLAKRLRLTKSMMAAR